MYAFEQEIYDKIIDYKQRFPVYSYEHREIREKLQNEINELLHCAMDEPLGIFSLEFVNNAEVSSFFSHNSTFHMRQLIENYILSKQAGSPESDNKLEIIKREIKNALERTLDKQPDFQYYNRVLPKAANAALLPQHLANKVLIKQIYLSQDQALKNAFFEHFPQPRLHDFTGQTLPPSLKKVEEETTQAIIKALKRAPEKDILKIQRAFRAKRRQGEEMQRIAALHFSKESKDEPILKAKALMAAANIPYQPQCKPELAEKIKTAVKALHFYSTVKHITKLSALESIFNDALYGQRTLLQFYLPFKRACLHTYDIYNGDGNVVCLGASKIQFFGYDDDTVTLAFDMKKLSENNPCAFFKQMDFGFHYNTQKRRISLGKLDFTFCFEQRGRKTILELSYSKKKIYAPVERPLLISYNTENIHEILTLNFFRFIDDLRHSKELYPRDNPEDVKAQEITAAIYSELESLSPEQLVTALGAIGSWMSDTMEYNLYANHQIDLSTLDYIENRGYRVVMSDFIKQLQEGRLEVLQTVKARIPQLFNSYRVLDYLMENSKNEGVRAELQSYRMNCTIPTFRKAMKV